MNILRLFLNDGGLVVTEAQTPVESLSGRFESSPRYQPTPTTGLAQLRVLPPPPLQPRTGTLWEQIRELAQRWETAAFLLLAAAGLFGIVLSFLTAFAKVAGR